MLMDMHTDGYEPSEFIPEKKKKSFYLLRVLEVKGGRKPVFVATQAESRKDAEKRFEAMRPMAPISRKERWTVQAVYCLDDTSDLETLENHPDLEIVLYIQETAIQTYVPIKIGRSMSTVQLRRKKNIFLHALSMKNRDKMVYMEDVEKKVSLHLLANGRPALVDLINMEEQLVAMADRNISIIFYEENLGDIMNYVRKVYSILEGKKIYLNFFYVTNDKEVYEVFLSDHMEIWPIFAG